MATGHACAKAFARLKAAIPHHSAPCFEAARHLEDALEKASLAWTERKDGHCRLCDVVPEIDKIAELVVNLEEEMYSLHIRILQCFALVLGTPYTPYSKTRRVLERECRALTYFLETISPTNSRCPDIMANQRTSTMFESAREFQISGASVASLTGHSNTINYFPVIFPPQKDSTIQRRGMKTTRNTEYDGLHASLKCPHCHPICDRGSLYSACTPVLDDQMMDGGLNILMADILS